MLAVVDASTSTRRCSSSPPSPAARSRRCRTSSTSTSCRRRRRAVRRGHRPGLARWTSSRAEHGFRRVFQNDPEIGGRYSALSLLRPRPGGAGRRRRRRGARGRRVARPELPARATATPGCGSASRSASSRSPGATSSPSSSTAPIDRVRPVGRAARRREHRQARPRHPAVADEPHGRRGRLRPRPRLPPHRRRGDPDERGAQSTRSRKRRPPDHHRPCRRRPDDLGRIFFLSEFATAVVGWVLEINPFDQPNVQEAKDATERVLERRGAGRSSPGEPRRAARRHGSPRYVAIMGYVPYSSEVDERGRASCASRSRSTEHRVGDHVRLRPALPALDRPVPQGRPARRRFVQLVRRARRRTSRSRASATRFEHAHPRPGRRRPEPGRRVRSTRILRTPSRGLDDHTESPLMQIGFVGLGKMGGNMVHRIQRDSDHQVVAFDFSAEAVSAAEGHGATGASSLEELVSKLDAPRMVWVMVPAGDATEQTVDALADLLDEGDTIIDGGNSRWNDDVRRAAALERERHQLRRRRDVRRRLGPRGRLLHDGRRPRGVGRSGWRRSSTCSPRRTAGGHIGAAGAGHYVKMVHNGVEYGMMQAYAEGFELMHKLASSTSTTRRSPTCGTRARSSARGCASWPARRSSRRATTSRRSSGHVADSGEGRWTSSTASTSRPAPVIAARAVRALLLARQGDYAHKVQRGAARPVRRPRGRAQRRGAS